MRTAQESRGGQTADVAHPYSSPTDWEGGLGPCVIGEADVENSGKNILQFIIHNCLHVSLEDWRGSKKILESWHRKAYFKDVVSLMGGQSDKTRRNITQLGKTLRQGWIYTLRTERRP